MHPFEYRVGFLGCPPQPEVTWDRINLQRLKDLGFNMLQVNIAWGYRPAEEPLNLEDVIDVPAHLASNVVMEGDQSPERRARRVKDLHDRARLGQAMGFRTLFHFGAPHVGDYGYNDETSNCLLDGKTTGRCLYLLREFARQFPEIDDILIYTYDQHAWLCNEFGPCPNCTGIPLHEREVAFLSAMKNVWLESHPAGRTWWEPWELSGGQVQRTVADIDPAGFGLMLHCNIAEVMATLPADRWLKNTILLAAERGIPAVAEYFLGAPSEEVEPYTHLAHPMTILRGLRDLARVPHIAGIKEYFGLLPQKEDPNLRMTGLFFNNPELSDEEALSRLAEPYGTAAASMQVFWRQTSEAFELFPWDTSWLIREIGKSDPVHSMSAAGIRGVPWHTPSWMSTRRAIFMKVDPTEEPDAWMLEDVQLRCDLAAARMQQALETGRAALTRVPADLAPILAKNLEELGGMRQRALAYVYHLRETNLAATMRRCRELGLEIPQRTIAELLAVLRADQANQGQPEPLGAAIALLQEDGIAFLETYFMMAPDQVSKGYFSLTSR